MNNKKVCSFYISEFHLFTILLPYINEKISEKKEITLILEENLENSVKQYLKNIQIYNKEKILKLNWKNSKNEKEIIERNIVVTIGKKEFINKVNKQIEKNEKIEEIINCYELEEVDEMDEIIKNYNYILKTKGEFYLDQNSHNEQKRKTIKSQI